MLLKIYQENMQHRKVLISFDALEATAEHSLAQCKILKCGFVHVSHKGCNGAPVKICWNSCFALINRAKCICSDPLRSHDQTLWCVQGANCDFAGQERHRKRWFLFRSCVGGCLRLAQTAISTPLCLTRSVVALPSVLTSTMKKLRIQILTKFYWAYS